MIDRAAPFVVSGPRRVLGWDEEFRLVRLADGSTRLEVLRAGDWDPTSEGDPTRDEYVLGAVAAHFIRFFGPTSRPGR